MKYEDFKKMIFTKQAVYSSIPYNHLNEYGKAYLEVLTTLTLKVRHFDDVNALKDNIYDTMLIKQNIDIYEAFLYKLDNWKSEVKK